MPSLNLRQVEAFRALLITGSVTKAAEIMHVTQPAVSRLIADFERAVGIKLFDRDRRKLAPTKECMALFQEVQRTYAGLEHISRAANAIRTMQTGYLSIVAMPILSAGFMPDVIAAFNAERSSVAISLWTWPREQALDWISSRQYDLGFVTMPVADSALTVEPFPELESVCILPLGHRLAAQEYVAPEDLRDESLVSLTAGSPHRHAVDTVLREHTISPRSLIEARSAAVILELVARSVGVAILGPLAVHAGVASRVVARPFRPAIPFQAALVYPTGLPLSRVARRFAEVAQSLYPRPTHSSQKSI